ncbi:Hypothetical protein A7982_09451 [Minicystis rosea]|nr:Hypothetical protein A7982_09451 [Minicystis rosea]
MARKIEVKAVFQELGEVQKVEGDLVTVRTALAEVTARRAASCLLAPAVGDRVLLCSEERGDAYVLAVLEQRDASTTTIAVEGDLALRSIHGKVSVAAQEGIDLVTAAAARIAASAVEVSAVAQLSVAASAVKAELDKVKMLATTIDSFVERVAARVKRSYRTVEELDQVKARHIDYAASGNAHVSGANTLVTAHDLVKLDGEQVHIG